MLVRVTYLSNSCSGLDIYYIVADLWNTSLPGIHSLSKISNLNVNKYRFQICYTYMYVCFILKSKNVSSPKHASFNKCHWECTVADFTYIQLIFNFITHSVCLIGNPFGIC